MDMVLDSGGEIVALTSELGWAGRLLRAEVNGRGAVAGSAASEPDAAIRSAPTVRVHIEATGRPFNSTGTRVITRGTHAGRGQVIMVDAGASGFDLRVSVGAGMLDVVARYRPPAKERLANTALRTRFGLLAGQILVHYPVLWRAGWRGRAPLHASVLATGAGTPVLAGPGGVGKSRLVASAIQAGATATADNLCCADAAECFGIVEPMRTDAVRIPGARTSHGRTSVPLPRRVSVLAPDRLIVLERGEAITTIEELPPAQAARALVAGTYAAGELRRYWSFAATLALATGLGPAHPPVEAVATALAHRVPCRRVRVGHGDVISAARLCDPDAATRSPSTNPMTTEGTR
jgi:hypothetical protein